MTTSLNPPGFGKVVNPNQVTLDHAEQETDQKQGIPEFQPLISSPAPARAQMLKPEKILLEHKRRIKNTPFDWLFFVIYVLSTYGFLILSIVLLLKAVRSDSKSAGIAYFSIFIFAVIALLVGVGVYQKKAGQKNAQEKKPEEVSK